jgi:hypothetical protein
MASPSSLLSLASLLTDDDSDGGIVVRVACGVNRIQILGAGRAF